MYGLTPNQSSKLVAKGRMKAIGIHWTEEEAIAIAKVSPADREELIAKLRGQPSGKVEGKLATPEEIAAEKEKAKAEKKAQADAKKAEAKAKKEAEKGKGKGK